MTAAVPSQPDMTPSAGMAALWEDAVLAAAATAVAQNALGGVALRACPGPVRDTWLEAWRDGLPPERPVRRIPLHIAESRLLGGLDLAATLRAGLPVSERGLLAECDGGFAMLAMAERATRSTVAHLATALDRGELTLAREGVNGDVAARLALIALDEGQADDEALSPVLRDRLAFHLDLTPLSIRDLDASGFSADAIAEARERYPRVMVNDDALEAICATAAMLGIDSLRACQFALACARAVAALSDRELVEASDLDAAARLVLAPRATRAPAPPPPEDDEEDEQQEDPPPESDQPEDDSGDDPEDPKDDDDPDNDDGENDDDQPGQQPLEDRILEAAAAAIPASLLASIESGLVQRSRGSAASGRSGVQQRSNARGRPMGTMPGDPRSGARLSLIDTLRTAAPWQRLRRSEQDAAANAEGPGIIVRRSDFRVTRFRERTESTIIFAVDASGSAALHRLAEAKGAVELLLNDCYVRRDQVALIAFRGEVAEMLLPPTRSLVRAKRNLSALPGGGGTPLASAIDAAGELAVQIQRRGGTPSVVLLTDARANITRAGKPGRQQAFEEALAAAAFLRSIRVPTMVIDTSPRPHPNAEALARALDGRYLPLPHADAAMLRDSVQLASGR